MQTSGRYGEGEVRMRHVCMVTCSWCSSVGKCMVPWDNTILPQEYSDLSVVNIVSGNISMV